MSLLSRIKSAFSRVFGGGGSSSSSRSSSSRATRRSTPTNYYRSSRGGSAYGGSNAGYEDPKVTAARNARERQKDAVKALASLSKQKSSIERQYSPRGNEGKGFNLAVKKLGEKATPPDAKLKQDMAQASRDRATAKLKSIEKKMPKVKSDTAMIRSGDYEYRPKAKNLNTPSADSRSSTRLTLQGYKKRMDNNAYRVSESFARGFGSDATFGTLDTLMRGNKDDKTEQAIEKYYQENKSSAAETAGRITGALLGFGLTGDLATSLGKEIAPAFIKKGGKYATEYLAKNPIFRKFAAKEAKKAGAEITEEVIERFAKQRAERIMGAVGKDVAINWTTGGLMDVNYALRDTYDENNGNFDARDFGKNLAKNRAWNYGLGGLLTIPPALRTQKGFLKRGVLGTEFLKKGARDDALELAGRIAEESRLRQAMTDAFVRDGDNAVRQFNMNDLLAQNSPLRQADEAVRPQTLDEAVRPQTLDEAVEKAAVETVENDASNVARTVEAPPMREEVAPPPLAEEPIPQAEPRISLKRKRKTDISVKPRDIRQENRALREEREQIVRELEDEFGSTRIDYNKLTPEQRAVATEKKLRLQEIDKQIEQNGKTLRQETRRAANAEKEPPRVSKAEREKELAKLRSEHSRLRKEIRDAEKNLESGKAEVDVDELNVKRTRLDELKDKIDRIETTTGTSAKPRKVRSDKGTKKTKVTPPTEKVQAEPKVEPTVEPRKYEDIDLSEGLSKEDRKVIRSKMRELEAKRNQLLAKDDKNPEIEDLGAEIGEIQRALKRETGVPAKKVNVEEVRAKQAVEEAQAKIDRNANSKPIKKAKSEPPKADQAKPKPPKKEKIVDEEKEHARLVREANEKLDEAGRLLREKSEGKLNVRQSAKTAVELGSNEQDKRYIKQISKSIEDFEQGIIDSDASYVYKVNTKASRDELAQKAFANARKSPDTIINDLKAKVADDVELGIEDVANMNAVMSMYHELGEQAPKEMEELAGRVQMQALTEKAQGLKSISLFLRENDPVYRKRYLNKDFVKFRELVCDERDWAKISASLDKKKGVEGYLDKEIAKLASLTGKENEKAFREAYVNLQRDIWRNSEPTRWELLNLIRHTFMLGSLKTSDNNLIGNFSQSSMWEVSDKMYALAEALASKTAKGKGMERTTTFKVKNKELQKFMNQIRSGTVAEEFEKLGAKPKQYADAKFGELLENARAEDVGNAMGTSKYGFKADKGWDFQYNSKLKKWSRKAIQAPAKAVGMMLSEPDSWFVERNYRKALARYLDSNGIHTAEAWEKNPELIKRAREYALDIAKENTYKKSARLVSLLEGQRAKGYRKDAKWTDVLKTIGLDAELPYLRVPYNLVVNNFKYSPVGLATNSVKALKAAYKGDTELLVKATKEMSKGLTGTGMMIAGFYLNCDDQMDENSSGFIADAKDYLKEYGIRDNSLKIGNKNYNLANFGIGTVEFLMGAKLAEDINAIGGAPESFLDYPEAVMSAFGTTFDVVADMSIMENGLALFDAISNWGDYDIELSERLQNVGAKVAGDYVGQYVPAPARAAARSFTSSDLDTGVKKGTDTTRAQRSIQRSANNVINSIPVLNEKVLPHKVDRHGNYVNERKTSADKWKAFGSNMTNPFSPREVNIPEADKVELSLTKDNGEPYQPKGYDENREYKGKVGQGKHAQTFDLTAKEREQAARSYKYSGEDMADNLVYSKNAWFGDSHGDRAQQILANVPADEEKAREYFYSTPEFQKLSPDMKLKFVKDLYDSRRGRGRAANHEVFVNIKGGSEGDFRYQNDLAWQQQDKYEENHLADYGITKEQWADIVEAARFESHKYKDGQNVDTINSAYKLKAALMSLDLSPEARVAAYNAYRGKRNSFGWYDWDGQTLKGYSRKGRRRSRRYRRRYYSSGSKSATVPKPKTIKATSFAQGEALVSKSKSSSSKKATPPQLKRVQAKIDLPTKR